MKFVGLLLLMATCAIGAEKFTLRYFYDKDNEALQISRIKWLTDKRAVAIAVLEDEKRMRGVLVETSDGGANWQIQPFKEIPRDLYFLDDSFGWIATENGIWHTEEGGRSWKKLKSIKGVLAVHFLDSKNGLIAGVPKMLQRTSDGGKKWTKVEEAEKPATRPEYTAYSHIGFVNEKLGQVFGYSKRPRLRQNMLPSWMEPEESLKGYQRPTALILLATGDGGNTWRTDTVSLFGHVTRVAFQPNGSSLSIFEFDDTFEYPGEVFRMGKGKGERIYRKKGELPTDVLIRKDGSAYLAVIEQVTELRDVPIPGRVRILRSEGPQYDLWYDMDVDYRATATRVTLTERPDGSLWAATNTGMILELVKR